ncbi:4537_t:CDS:2 [Ambispora gerdemannii]|uniref:4537_t:CDS:1 n=1 Tax=Ambispora gerdemannii TaxID=144530 RepID=A0A9N8YUW1_9GLOM|nr:4537_t:CDS:2 [Ambispora gerdemannii]
MIETLKVIKKNHGDIIILSDANVVFIDIILKANKVDNLISQIITNPADWEDTGRLRVHRLHPTEIAPHGCLNKCALNICKGTELVNYLAPFIEQQENYYNQILYVGDSINDFCPATKMKSNDVVLVRKGYALERFLNSPGYFNDDDLGGSDKLKKMNRDKINARIVYWKDASDILNTVKNEFELAVAAETVEDI